MTDSELYVECKKWGTQALHARWKFAGLLPEVQKRKLYEKKGFSSIYEFAAKLAGMSKDQVNRVFYVNNKLADKPKLQSLLVQGEVSVNKLARVTSIATEENQDEIAEKVKVLSQKAIEVFARESRSKNSNVRAHENFDFEIINAMSPELKSKIKELMDKGHDINQILLELLNKRETEIEVEMEQIDVKPAKSRYINVKTRRIIADKFGNNCAKEGCVRPAENIHHGQRFAQHHTHNPIHLKPLCKAHHELVHEKDENVQKFRRLMFA